jgi:hypothetical protein
MVFAPLFVKRRSMWTTTIAGDADRNNVDDGELSDGDVSLLELNEALTLTDIDLPFSFQVLHAATTDVDFDDILASIASGTFGFTLPISLSEEDVVLDIPMGDFEIGANGPTNQPENQFYADAGAGQHGYVELEHLAAELTGQVVLDINADLEISADLFATAVEASAINVVPEPSSFLLAAISGLALAVLGLFRRGS